MDSLGCGCKICKQGLGDKVNEMIVNQIEPIAVLKFLNAKECKVSEKLLKKHLSAFSIGFPKSEIDYNCVLEPIPNNLVDIDFTEYNIDFSNPEITLDLLYKINLKVFLNQSRITLKAQEDVIIGKCPDIPKDVLRNQTLAVDMLDKSALFRMLRNDITLKQLNSKTLEVQAVDSNTGDEKCETSINQTVKMQAEKVIAERIHNGIQEVTTISEKSTKSDGDKVIFMSKTREVKKSSPASDNLLKFITGSQPVEKQINWLIEEEIIDENQASQLYDILQQFRADAVETIKGKKTLNSLKEQLNHPPD